MRSRSGSVAVILIVIILVIGLLVLTFSGANFQRTIKSWKSNYTGGLYRIVSVYDYNGNLLREYGPAMIDISESENETFFDYNGNRIVIHNAIVIVEEVNK